MEKQPPYNEETQSNPSSFPQSARPEVNEPEEETLEAGKEQKLTDQELEATIESMVEELGYQKKLAQEEIARREQEIEEERLAVQKEAKQLRKKWKKAKALTQKLAKLIKKADRKGKKKKIKKLKKKLKQAKTAHKEAKVALKKVREEV